MQHDGKATFELSAYNRTFRLDLRRNDYLFHPEYKEVRVGADGLEVATTGRENCYYHGKVLDASSSTVAVDTCSGLRGMIIVDGKRFQVLPAATHFNLLASEVAADADVGAEPHMIYSEGDVDADDYNIGSVSLEPSTSRARKLDEDGTPFFSMMASCNSEFSCARCARAAAACSFTPITGANASLSPAIAGIRLSSTCVGIAARSASAVVASTADADDPSAALGSGRWKAGALVEVSRVTEQRDSRGSGSGSVGRRSLVDDAMAAVRKQARLQARRRSLMGDDTTEDLTAPKERAPRQTRRKTSFLLSRPSTDIVPETLQL